MSDDRSSTPLWILSGFLGSGKTTVLNVLIRQFWPNPIGVLVNDFGTISVDRRLVEIPENNGITVIDLNGGQIFCSCISGSFVDCIAELVKTHPAAILVESSGLAKPHAMGSILDEALVRTGDALHFAGMVTVVDAPRFASLEQVVNAVDEQIVYSDLVVLNKADLADGPAMDFARRRLQELNPGVDVIETSFGLVGRPQLPERPRGAMTRSGPGGVDYRGWDNAKPHCFSWTFGEPPSPKHLERLVRELAAGGALRIKGFVRTTMGDVFVSAAGDTVEVVTVSPARSVSEDGNAIAQYGLTIFERARTGAASEGMPIPSVAKLTRASNNRCV